MIDCEKAAALLSARRDGELEGSAIPRLEEHLSSCRDCRERAVRFESVDDLVLHCALPGIASDPRTAAPAGTVPPAARRWARILPLGAAALVVAALALVVLFLSDQAGAGDAEANFAAIEEMSDAMLDEQDALLETFALDLNAMKLQVRCATLDERERRALLEKIENLLAAVEKTRRSNTKDMTNRQGDER